MAQIAEETNQIIFGIKGKSIFSEIFDVPLQVPLDCLHLVFQGHFKWLLKNYLFGYKKDAFNIGKLNSKFVF